MLSKTRLVVPASSRLVFGTPAASRLMSSARDTEEKSGNTYEDFKQAAKRTGDAAKEWMEGAGQHGAKGAYQAVQNKAEEAYEATKRAAADITSSAKEAVQSGMSERENMQSARAVFEETRDPARKAEEDASRKSQLLDEATAGDNPKEATARDDKQILPNDFYTRH